MDDESLGGLLFVIPTQFFITLGFNFSYVDTSTVLFCFRFMSSNLHWFMCLILSKYALGLGSAGFRWIGRTMDHWVGSCLSFPLSVLLCMGLNISSVGAPII